MNTEPRAIEPPTLLARLAQRETLVGAIAIAFLLVLFFSTPLARYRYVYYSSADLMQDFSLTRVAPNHAPGNKLLSDAVTQMQPWLMFNRDELRAGRIPLWNPYNGDGCPHVANYQSALFSPFSAPFYVLSMRAALLVSAFLKLWLLGFLTFLFLKELCVKQIAALIGATAFMFSGHNIVLLSFPHVGAVVALPAGFLFVEKAIRRVETWHRSGGRAAGVPRPRLYWLLCGLTATFAAGLLAGNPEPFYFAALFVGLFAAVRLFFAWCELGKNRRATRDVARLGLELGTAAVLAAGLTALQTLTFFEYLQRSRVLEQRSLVQTPLYPAFWPLMMFPNVLGNPSSAYNLSYELPQPNYELVNMAYIGALVLLLAAVSLVFVRRDRYIAFFAVCACVWVFYAYDFFGASTLFASLPTLDRAPINRSQIVWLFCLSACAALCVDHLQRRDVVRAWTGAACTVLAGAALLAACLIGADELIDRYATLPSPNHALFLSHVPEHIRSMSLLFVAGSLAASCMWLVRSAGLRNLAGVGILGVVFLHSGWLLKDYNPVTENRFFYPRTAAVTELEKQVGGNKLAILNEDKIPPDANLAYRLATITNYDGMWIRQYDFLFRHMFGNAHNWRPILKGNERALGVFGVDFVLAKWGWLNFDSGLTDHPVSPDTEFEAHEILPDRDASQVFTAHRDRLQAVCVWLGTYPLTHGRTLTFRLGEARTGRAVCELKMNSDDIQADIYTNHHLVFPNDFHTSPPCRPVVFRFPPIPDCKEKQYRWTISCRDGVSSNTVVAWTARRPGYTEGLSFWGRTSLRMPYLFDYSYNLEDFARVAAIGDYELFRFKKSTGKFHTVGHAALADTDDDALALLQSPSFDPRREVILSACESPPAGARAQAAVKPRLVKTRDADKVYLVSTDGRTLVPIPDAETFVANRFKWSEIEIISRTEFEKLTILESDLAGAKAQGLRVVETDAPDVKPLEIVEERADFARLRVERTEPGYLAIAQAHYPGWKARINGTEARLQRANYAFSALELPSGACDIEIYYDPLSVKLGIWIGVASAVAGLLLGVASYRSLRVA
jgi:hypothetical protein